MPNTEPETPVKLVLDTSKLEPWEIAALLDTLLAYPHAKLKRLQDVVTSRCAAQIRETIAYDPDRRKELLERYPAYNPARSRTSTGRMHEDHKNAQRAGAVFLAMIKDTAKGAPPKFYGMPAKATLDFLVA
ncbi:MAG: hypothetical protein KDE32_05475 [Novosphingobium sp.]|nr:hypothetical protein [Novosphingobium sp.]